MKKGFTLLELLIVIGILAILATAATLVLNPAQLLAQARDAQRISDMDAIKASLSLYLTDVATPDLNGTAITNSPGCDSGATGQPYVAAATTQSFQRTGATVVDATREVDGSGWLPVALTGISGGSPLALLPVDPTNSGDRVYRYACDQTNLTFELNACLESAKYLQKMAEDGGDRGTGTLTGCGTTAGLGFYEIGTDNELNL